MPPEIPAPFVPTRLDGEDGESAPAAATGPVAPGRPEALGTLEGLVAPDELDAPDTLDGLETGGSEVIVAVALSFDMLDAIGITSLSPISARSFEME